MPIFGGPSSAGARFEAIRTHPDPFSYLSGLVSTPANPTFEEEWLDFKGNPRDDGDTKKIWSKALAGFANITDGLLIWGIDARKDKATGRDVADKLSLIPDPFVLKTRLRELQPDATNAPMRRGRHWSRREMRGTPVRRLPLPTNGLLLWRPPSSGAATARPAA
jgi:hypothetical protein